MKVRIIVNLLIEGMHCWPECNIKEVEFLKHLHRHQFAISAIKTVSHTNRDTEIILFKSCIANYIERKFGRPANFGRLSCEDIALILAKEFQLARCIVLEDGENGAEVEI